MQTTHRIRFGDARAEMTGIAADSVDLIVTSPPYPMIAMWDEAFAGLNPSIRRALEAEDGLRAFEAMHAELDRIWREAFRVLKPGGLACVNIGDATRTIGGEFQLYPNHARILQAALALGFTSLPDILWRKPTNSPTKFMGSGMLPAGAYVTYEHEYVLILRKGGKRRFQSAAEKRRRRESAFFWEERNTWFSDLWTDLNGTGQEMRGKEARTRSAAFPFELAFRLVLMHSAYGDLVLDPFLGTGTTSAACVAAGRESLGIEIDPSLCPAIGQALRQAVEIGKSRAAERIADHVAFVEKRRARGKTIRYTNRPHRFGVMSAQEQDLIIRAPERLARTGEDTFRAEYAAAVPREDLVLFEP